ncbi:MAG: peptidoglycan/xylan/chitin deacetylase (PgdA/CDA1 family) [Alphaproteobacteria bacterium]|jgi:peptidoglycan/xylan/chitin deacetylase (PgdA/CDA1 family)
MMAPLTALAIAVAMAGPGVRDARAQSNATPSPDAAGSAVVVMYHRFNEAKFPSTNIRLEQFEAHLKELTNGKYTVMALPKIMAALKAGRKLPSRTVAITIDDAFASVYREAWPRLKAAKLPFTLFVSTNQVSNGSAEYMSWDQVRELAKAGVTIGNHSGTHAHLADQGRARIRAELDNSNGQLVKELGFKPTLHAYPYGEASTIVIEEVRKTGFTAAFGQHSGVLHDKANKFYLPRFTMNENFGSMQRFRMAINALPLYATDISPSDPTLGKGVANPPAFGFTIGEGVPRLTQLACYSSQHGKLAIERLGARRMEVRLPSSFRPGRSRINCTLPAHDARWRWFGYQYYTSKP